MITGFVDAEAMHQKYQSFDVPSYEELDEIGPGTLVKVCRNDERFWLKVLSRDGEKIRATVNNRLVLQDDLPFGTEVEVERRHVYRVINPMTD